MDYKPTVYEQIVLDYINDKLKNYQVYEKEWKVRGLTQKDYLQYIKDIAYAESLLDLPHVNIVKASQMAKEYVKNGRELLLLSSLKKKKRQF